ncbi:MAG: hypothetical protein JRN21_02505 [Nitrososphaerota archaeon]|nr:hypothetical protein [Nitrososphaerota archaeon]
MAVDVDERTCRQGEVRDCVQPSSTTPSLDSLCQDSLTCQQAILMYEGPLGSTGGVGVATVELGPLAWLNDGAMVVGDAMALYYIQSYGPQATPTGVLQRFESGYSNFLEPFREDIM